MSDSKTADSHGDEAGAQLLAERSAQAMYSDDKASQALGIILSRIAPGEATMTMTVREDMINGHGTCHGGFTFLLADSTFAFACNSYNRSTVAASADISFLKAIAPGDTLTATAREVFREGRNGIYDIAVTDQNGATVAMFRGRSRTIRGTLVAETPVSETHDQGES